MDSPNTLTGDLGDFAGENGFELRKELVGPADEFHGVGGRCIPLVFHFGVLDKHIEGCPIGLYRLFPCDELHPYRMIDRRNHREVFSFLYVVPNLFLSARSGHSSVGKMPRSSLGLAFLTAWLGDAKLCRSFACQVAFFHIFLFIGQNATEVL
jgi:hypothetical protein